MLEMTYQVRGEPYWWIRKRSTTLTSEYQDCHTQLQKKQNISEFKSLCNGSKIILIEQHFKPTSSTIMYTIQSAKNSKEIIREMGNVELFELCEAAPKVQCSQCLLIGIKELCIALADRDCLIDSESNNI